MKIILDKKMARNIYDKWKEWNAIGNERDFTKWRIDIVDRENRREAIVYKNCACELSLILRNAVDEQGDRWWLKLHSDA